MTHLDHGNGTETTFINYENSERRDVPREGSYATVREFFGRSTEVLPGPQGFLVEVVPPPSTFRAHFHSIDQFQLFFPAEGAWYQRQPIDSVILHYADAYATYGPFGTDTNPMSFYTLRPAASELTGYMPGSREKLPYRGRRNLHTEVGSRLEKPATVGESRLEILMEPEDDGLAAYLMTAGPSTLATTPPNPRHFGGQYFIVMTGALLCHGKQHPCGGERFGERSVGWSGRAAPPVQLAAGPDSGFEVLVLRLPVPTTIGKVK
jgi:hypothetical protein